MGHSADILILRDLSRRYIEVASKPIQDQRRRHWRAVNARQAAPPPIYIRACAWHEMPQSKCQCQDDLYRQYEDFFRRMIFQDTFNDDYIIEPWVTVQAACITPPQGLWGLPINWTRPDGEGGAGVWEAPLKDERDIDKLVAPQHEIDEAETQRRLSKLSDAIGNIVTIHLDRGPIYRMWNADLSTNLAQLRGLEQIMWDMMDRPAWLHQLLAFMRDSILRVHEQAEKAGDWSLANHQNQAMPYAADLADPVPNGGPAPRKSLWTFCASQELTAVGAEMFDEFMLQYQIPIMSKFALSAYGCCEDLTHKVAVLRKIPNLRRIAAAPACNVAALAGQVGTDYVISYRPSPADMVAYGFAPDRIRAILRRDFAALRGCHIDVTLKDVETVQRDPERIRGFVQIVRQIIEEFWE